MSRPKKETGDVLYFDLDLRRIGLGRVAKSARTRDIDVYHKRKGILQTLQDRGRLDVLRAWKDDQISIEELHALNEQQMLFEAMELVLFRRSLWDAFAATIERMGKSTLTRQRYQSSIDKLMRVGNTEPFKKQLGPGATVGDLKKVDWEGLQNAWGGSAADWNHLHRMLSHFLSKFVGKKSSQRNDIIESVGRKKESPRVVMITIATLFKIRDALPERLRAVPMTLLLTGMRRTEYLSATKAHLRPDVCGVMIPQTLADPSTEPVYVDKDLWHWIEAGIPSPLKYKWLRIHWQRACAAAGVPGLRLHDLRHALGLWAAEAGVPLHEVMVALRHDKIETTAIYLRTIGKKNVAKVIGEIVVAGEKAAKKAGTRRKTLVPPPRFGGGKLAKKALGRPLKMKARKSVGRV